MAQTRNRAGAAAAAGGAVLAGGRRPQMVTARPSTWTRAMAARFVEVLAESCNVTMAARAIGRSVSNVYKRREKDADFRLAWDRALAAGYSRLEMMMLERALHGVEKTVIARDGTTTVMREYSDRVALTLLRMHRETVLEASAAGPDSEDYGEACERIMARLARIRAREEGDEVERKARGDLLGLLRWARGRR